MEDDIKEPFLNYQDNENDADIDKEIAQKIKRGFILKVYGILIYQIFITSFLVFLGFFFSSFRRLLLGSDFLYMINLLITLGFLFLPGCYPNISTSSNELYRINNFYSWIFMAYCSFYLHLFIFICYSFLIFNACFYGIFNYLCEDRKRF